jgi:tetratricopeptide (TPR) repeat protein
VAEASEQGHDGYHIDALHMLAIVEPGEPGLAWNLRALDVAEQSIQPDGRRWRGSLLNNIGWTFHDMGRYHQALEMFERALAVRRQVGTPTSIRIAAWAVARAQRSLGNVAEALRMQQQLAQELEAAGETDGYVDEELAECLLALGREDEAAPHFRRAHELLAADSWLADKEPARLARLQALGSPPDP